MDGVTDTVEEELEDEELWDAKDLKIPVYNTEDGISHSLFNLGTYRLNFFWSSPEMSLSAVLLYQKNNGCGWAI